VRTGQPVAVRVDAYPGRAFTGKVAAVGLAADPRVRTFTVKVRVSNPEHLLRPGMFARGEITVERREQVLVVPRDAVVTVDGQTSIFLAAGGKARARRIRLGLTNGARVEVLSGLQKGESVIVAGQSGLVDGTPVLVR
jgi:membrane fusion protein (multidrug efflux system)